ncbi:rhodanese-like domain-containing protein [Permianibacter sp. IMCC34836]|uniref:rhodanese-like domain-containing protein n=1 Tax=Permianibacter fluminis TaxID=2738515 RepID=UPI0015579211|nr:rhodanese-like domain-containing protein [Permianibacter fluminis]NQD36194.1 rhodanese-like domain-containing protein [Permianibacter fluminis]
MQIVVELFTNHPYLSVAWLTLLMLVIASFSSAGGGKAIGPQQLTTLVNRQDGVVLDIRPLADFNKGHIVGAVSAPLSKLDSMDKELERYKERPVIVVCAQGMTAVNACKQLKKQGFAQLFRLGNGMQAWTAENLPISKK